MKARLVIPALCLILFFAIRASATLRLPEVLSDHMVMQQQTNVTLWGWAFAGETVQVETSWGVKEKVLANQRGEWALRVRTPAAQPLASGLRPEYITFTVANENMIQIKDILIGEVWLCSGQSNMEMLMRPGYPPGWCNWKGEVNWEDENKNKDRMGLRMFDVTRTAAFTPQVDCSSTLASSILHPPGTNGLIPSAFTGWQSCTRETRPYFHAVPYYFGAALQDKLGVPVGLMAATVGGTPIESWMSLASLRAVPGYSNVTTTALNPLAGSPACLYNGMISPLTPMKIQGTIWYQGESNLGTTNYATLFQRMITDWRRAFDRPDMPFYFVQIAPCRSGRGTKAAELREAQASALQMTNTGMAVTIDIGDINNIHPKNKRDVGRRLAWQALVKTYGFKDAMVDGPTPESFAVKDGKMQVVFRNTGGNLVARDFKPLTCFELAGDNGAFVKADAIISGNYVVVSSSSVTQPKHVRFAWGDADVPNLVGKNGLPVAQFRASVK